MAFLIFAEEAVDIVVLEVGLGGRLDATNVVHPELCVITPVDFDHEAFLGRSLQEIAGEKAGILKAGVPPSSRASAPEAAAVLDQRAAQLSIPSRPHRRMARRRTRARSARQPLPPQRRARTAHRLPARRRTPGRKRRHRRRRPDSPRRLRSRYRGRASRRPAGPAAWSASPSIPRSSSMAPTIPPAPAPSPPTSNASTPAAVSA